jgi:hypothetical protein
VAQRLKRSILHIFDSVTPDADDAVRLAARNRIAHLAYMLMRLRRDGDLSGERVGVVVNEVLREGGRI